MTGAGRVFFVCVVSFALSLTAFVAPQIIFPEPIPSFQEVRSSHRPSDIPLLDRRGVILHELRTDARSRRFAWSPLADISPAVPHAVIVSEDQRFFTHHGVDWRALLGVVARAAVGAPLRGASTITMQVVTLLERRQGAWSIPAPRRRPALWEELKSKWRQMRRAWALERSWSKAEILEAYLNLVPFRGELEGITAASYLLFDKAPHGLTKGEATVLAVMLRAPNASPQLLLRRAERLYDARSDTMSRDEISKSVALVMHAPVSFSDRTSLAPHLARRLLSEQGRHTPVQSTLESRIQRFALETLRRQLLAVHEQGVEDGAVLVVDNATGDVLAYVGGSGELSSASYVDGVHARRQAGSTLKPFLYGLALENRLLTPASLLEDAPLDVAVAGGVYRPRNYDEQFKGLISMRTALASSLNVPAVRTLALVGEDVFTQKLRALGLQGVAESGEFYGPSLALGSVDVTLWELVNAYRTLANGGEWSPLRMTVEEVTSRKSQVESQKFTSARRVYSAETAFLVSSILSDRESRSTTFGLENVLATSFWSAVKTGTSKDMRDNWCVGYSSRYTVGVWVGNFSGAPMKNVSGVTGAAPIWAEMMTWLQHVTPSQPPRPPAGVVAQRVVFPRRIEAEREEWFFQGTEPRDVMPDLAREQARIVAPVDGVLIALDPDIPPARQRIMFEAASSQATLSWRLDGTRVGTAARPFLWEPRPGRHTLTLCDEHDAPVDTIRFFVRGLAEHVAGRN